MPNNFKCPFCNSIFPLIPETYRKYNPCFEHADNFYTPHKMYNSELYLHFHKCPQCGKYTIFTECVGVSIKSNRITYIHPLSTAIQFPEYIPQAIREDYEEACAIINLSPKSSATLARRCLQTMIRDFWGITEKSLYDEISKLEKLVLPEQWRVLNSLRKLGNIGAHPEKDINLVIDIEPSEARKMLKVIEILMDDWYIKRHEIETAYADVFELEEEKDEERRVI